MLITWPCSLQLVATYHCDQAYAFDVSGTGACTTAFSSSANDTLAETSGGSSDVVMEDAEPLGSASKQPHRMPTRQAQLHLHLLLLRRMSMLHLLLLLILRVFLLKPTTAHACWAVRWVACRGEGEGGRGAGRMTIASSRSVLTHQCIVA